MSRLRATLRTQMLRLIYPIYYRMPHRIRITAVRLVAPTFTVGAVVLLKDAEHQDGERMLLLRQPPGRGWSLPAGLLGRGESPIEGALRELAEESGVRLTAEQLRPAVPNAMVHHRGRWVDIVFEAEVPARTTPLRVDGAEVWEAAWHRLDDLPTLTRPTARLLGVYQIGPEAPAAAPVATTGTSTPATATPEAGEGAR